jgi:hypothetical protein
MNRLEQRGGHCRKELKGFPCAAPRKVQLREWPTIVKPCYESKKDYQELLEEHVEELISL